MDDATGWLKTSLDGGQLKLAAGGSWTIRDAAILESALEKVSSAGAEAASIELSQVTEMDTAGAWLVRRTALSLEASGVPTDIGGMAEAFLPLGRIVELTADCATQPVSTPHNYWRAMVERVGRATFDCLDEGKALLSFYGQTVVAFGALIRRPGRLRYTALVNQIELTGLNAIPIVCLLSFLIGIVIAFVGADQLRRFGAEIFTVNLLGVIMLREIGVLMTAIMVAGRSGSAYTAQIGTMQVNEEIDALRTLGLDPMDVLVIPRISGLLISLPILAFLAEIAGLLGGAMMATMVLDVTFTQFIRQLESVVTLNHFAVGMVKAPVFAYIIAIVGCYEGLRVGGSAESVGRMTTKSVVTSIFLVIIADAIFSVIFSTMRI
jgi:phospholipid/cholesterol/gamma-HCH transport system permease protein